MRFATNTQDGVADHGDADHGAADHEGQARAGAVSDAGIHPLAGDVTVVGLVRAGLAAGNLRSRSERRVS